MISEVLTTCFRARTTVLAISLIAVSIFAGFSTATLAQGSQLSLADILIALRSKKVTLPERNKILAEAIDTRGTTFSLTPEIEKELSSGGADRSLIDSIRKRSQIVRTTAVMQPPFEAKPKSPPVAVARPDFSFYEKAGDESNAKGDLDAALINYTKAIEMNGADLTVRLSRGAVYLSSIFNRSSNSASGGRVARISFFCSSALRRSSGLAR